MIWPLYGLIVIVALILVIIGTFRPTESAQALVGFVILFLLGVHLVAGGVEYVSGKSTNSTITKIGDNVSTSVTYEAEVYSNFNDNNSHLMGFYLAAGAIIGFACVFINLKSGRPT